MKFEVLFKIILLPFFSTAAFLYAFATLLRNIIFDLRILKIRNLSGVQVISIGNLTAGGTGKTPLTAFLIEALARQGVKAGIVSRGYRGSYRKHFAKSSVQVNAKLVNAADIFGDEPTWYSEKLNAPVWVGQDKYETALALIKASADKIKVILADDAFQHRQLGRKVDVLVIDACAGLIDYLPLPLGRGREDCFLGIKRADIIVLNKVNLVSQKQALRLKNILLALKSEASSLVEASSRIEELVVFGTSQIWKASALKNESVFLVCSIAMPEQFLRLMIDCCEVRLAGQLALPDHAPFSKEIIQKIQRLAAHAKAKYIVVTEKDAVKLRGVEMNLPILVSHLKLSAPELLDAVWSRISH